MRYVFGAASSVSIFVVLAIFYILVSESLPFFKTVSIWRFFTERQWMPLFADPRYGIISLISGTLVTSCVAIAFALPVGLAIAAYLSEYASDNARNTIKPILELLSAVPTVIYGYFALLFVTPILQRIYPGLPGFNMLSAGLVMGVMILPYVASLTEDALRAVPRALKEGAYALGSTRLQVTLRVVFPAAASGITAALILAMSRAVGETMIVAIAAGMQSAFTLNPLESGQTMTAYIVQVSLGDLPHGSIGYQSIFAVGLTLCCITLIFNMIGQWVRVRFREVYE